MITHQNYKRMTQRKVRKKQCYGIPKFLIIVLVCLCVLFLLSIYTASKYHVIINFDYEGAEDVFDYFPVQLHTDDTPRDLLLSVLKRTSGEKWTIPSWDSLDEDQHDGDNAEVRWANFTSTTGITRPMAIHPHFDFISRAINNKHRWSDCDVLPQLWNQAEDRSGKRNIYMEIGANIGSCIMEMLLSTDAPILAFEPHPKNQLCLRKTISRLEPEYQNRIILVPVALGEAQGSSTIYSASNNMGNSVVGKIIKDYDTQIFDEKSQFEIPIERLDSIIKSDTTNIDFKVLKLDAQGYECKILEGMGPNIARSIQNIKFEYAQKWIEAQNCLDLLPKMRELGFNIYRGKNIVNEDSLKLANSDLIAKQSL